MEKRLNLHIDEAGQQDLSEGLYLVAIVLHDHADDIEAPVKAYEERLKQAGLADIPFHGKDLLHGNEAYAKVSVGDRKRLLTQFARLARTVPVTYSVLHYSRSQTHDRKELEARIRREQSDEDANAILWKPSPVHTILHEAARTQTLLVAHVQRSMQKMKIGKVMPPFHLAKMRKVKPDHRRRAGAFEAGRPPCHDKTLA